MNLLFVLSKSYQLQKCSTNFVVIDLSIEKELFSHNALRHSFVFVIDVISYLSDFVKLIALILNGVKIHSFLF